MNLSEIVAQALAPEPETPPETPAEPETPAPETPPEPETPAEPAPPTLDELARIAQERRKEVEARQPLRNPSAEAELAALKAQASVDAEDARRYRDMSGLGKKSPLELIEKLGFDPVAFVRDAWREANDKEAFQSRTEAQRVAEELERFKQEQATAKEQEATQRAREAEVSRNQRALFAEVGSGKYPATAALAHDELIEKANMAASLLLENGHATITHDLVARVIEATLAQKAPAANPATATSGATSAPQGAVTTATKQPASPPRTITQESATVSGQTREMTPEERHAAALEWASSLISARIG